MSNQAPERRRFRFSLRTLFVVVTLFACWLGLQTNGILQQRRAIEMIRSHGGRVSFRHQRVSSTRFDRSIELQSTIPLWLRKLMGEESFMEVVDADLRWPPMFGKSKYAQPPGDDEIALLGSLTALEELRLVDIPISDEGFWKLRRLTNLTELCVVGSKLTDDSMEVIGGFKQLTNLCVDRSFLVPGIPTPITNKGLQAIADLKNIDQLWLRGTLIDDAGLAHLSGFQKLFALELSENRVSGDGLVHLARLPLLRILSLNNTSVGDRGIMALAPAPALITLELNNTQITDEALLTLASFANLSNVRDHGTLVTSAGRLQFQRNKRAPAKPLPEQQIQTNAE